MATTTIFNQFATALYRHRDAAVFWFIFIVGGAALTLSYL